LRLNLWQLAGMPVIGSRRPLSWDTDHDGVIRRSEDEFSEVISKGISGAVAMFDVLSVTEFGCFRSSDSARQLLCFFPSLTSFEMAMSILVRVWMRSPRNVLCLT